MDGGLFMSVAFDAVQLSDVYRTVRKICRTEYVATCRSVLGSYCLFNTDGPLPSYVASRERELLFWCAVPRKIGKKYKIRKERRHESKKQGQRRRRMLHRSDGIAMRLSQINGKRSAYESKDYDQSR